MNFLHKKENSKTQTGTYKGKRFSVISTGIGPDNIDIVVNEIDALFNIDLETREIKKELTSVNIVRIGTSGSLQADIPVNSFVLSQYGLGLDNMMRSYLIEDITDYTMEEAFIAHTQWDLRKGRPYFIQNSPWLEEKLSSDQTFKGITGTAGGFYGPQGRVLRLGIQDPELNHKIDNFKFNDYRITNFEMETSAIYGLAKLLGHHAVSLNTIIANRANGTFSEDPYAAVDQLILYTLDKLSQI
ncbi:uridine phosphorylase [Myroides gitamensis]|nr:uridine phosphorylase [Myroides gitamensis]